jgi:hypothetical protein
LRGVLPPQSDANYFNTVASTLLELGEAIEREELYYRMLCPDPQQDDWARQLVKMRTAAVRHMTHKARLLRKEREGRDGGQD